MMIVEEDHDLKLSQIEGWFMIWVQTPLFKNIDRVGVDCRYISHLSNEKARQKGKSFCTFISREVFCCRYKTTWCCSKCEDYESLGRTLFVVQSKIQEILFCNTRHDTHDRWTLIVNILH